MVKNGIKHLKCRHDFTGAEHADLKLLIGEFTNDLVNRSQAP